MSENKQTQPVSSILTAKEKDLCVDDELGQEDPDVDKAMAVLKENEIG